VKGDSPGCTWKFYFDVPIKLLAPAVSCNRWAVSRGGCLPLYWWY